MSRAQVAQLRQDAERAIKAIEAQPIPDDDGVRTKRDRALTEATELLRLAKDPITIGVVGEFSAGKSLLIGTLLGKPDLLPIEGRATTGNVTALRLMPAESGTDSHIDDREPVVVEYLSEDRLNNAARYMVRQLIEAAVNVPGLDTAPLTELVDTALDDLFASVETWCRQLWSTGATKEEERNPEVKHAAWELLRLRETVRNAATLVGQSLEVSQKMAKAALDLGDRAPIPKEFPEPRIQLLDRDTVRRNPDALRATFLLIRRVVYTVRVPAKIWDLSALRDENEVMLLDFPGLGSEASHNRDEHLCERELEDVSTILVVLKGDHPGAKGPQKFYSMMQKPGRSWATLADAILIAGNQFDRVAAPTLPSAEPVDITRITSASEDLRGFRTTVRDLIDQREHQCQVVSSVAAMDYYQLSYHEGSPESREKIALAVREAGPKVAVWGELGRRLEAARPGDPWGAQLRALGTDGGIAALRALIENHAQIRGLRLKVEVMDRHRQIMVTHLERLCRAITTAASPVATARQQGQRLSAFLRELVTGLQSVRRQAVDPTQFPASAGSAVTVTSPLVDQLRAETVRRVYEWPQWNDILGRAENFVVPRRAVAVRRRRSRVIDEWASEDTDTTTVLFRSFQAVVAEVGELAADQVLAAAKSWAEDRHQELAPLRERYADEELRELVQRAFDELEREQRRRDLRLTALEDALDLEWLSPAFDDEVANLGEPDQEVTDRFPLRSDHLLPWHPQRSADPDTFTDRATRHQIEVFRIRRAVARAAADLVAEYADTVLSALGNLVREEIEDRIQPRIPTAIDLRRIAPTRARRGAPPAAEEPREDPSSAPVCVLLAEWSMR